MTATTIDFTQTNAARRALSAGIVPGVVLVLALGAVLGLLSFLLGLGNIVSGMHAALGALAIVWFGAKCLAKDTNTRPEGSP